MRRRHDRIVEIWYSDKHYGTSSDVNALISGSIGFETPRDVHPFHNSMVVMGVNKRFGVQVKEYREITPANLRVALSHFLQAVCCLEIDDNDDPSTANKCMIFDDPQWFKAVEVANTMYHYDRNKFNAQMVMLNRDHPNVAKYDNKSQVCERMGILLVFKKHLVDRCYVGYTNIHANLLLMNIDVSADNHFCSVFGRPKPGHGRDPTYLVFR